MKDEEESFISRPSMFARAGVRDVWLIWLILVLLTTIPYLVALSYAPAGSSFSGVLTAHDDTFTYFAWMRQGADGNLLMCNPFTSEPQRCEFFLPLWGVLGLISRVTGLSIPVTFHVARLVAAFLLLIVARAVIRMVNRSQKRGCYTLWLYTTSSGFGWIVFWLANRSDLLGPTVTSGSADLNLPEAVAFRSVFSQVHFTVGAFLVCGVIGLLFTALVERKSRHALLSGVLVSLLAVIHPYMVVVACSVGGVGFLALPWLSSQRESTSVNYSSHIRMAVAFCCGAAPGFAYAVYLNLSSEVLREWLRVTDTFSPPPWEYAFGFGLVGALAVPGARLLWNRRAPYGRLVVIWALVQAGLLYAPVSIQRRFVEALQLPIVIAASASLFWTARMVFKGENAVRNRRLFLICFIAFASLTNLGFWIGQVARAAAPGRQDPRSYLKTDLVAAFDWIKANSSADAVLFSSYLTGNVAPAATGLRVFLGHYAQTLRSDEKGAQVTTFYKNEMPDEAARRLFAEHRVRYVIYGDFERTISSDFEAPGWLSLAHQNNSVSVFEVTAELGPGLNHHEQ